MAPSVKCPTSAQVTISWFVSWSPALGSVLTAQSLEPVSDSVSPSLSAPSPLTLCLCDYTCRILAANRNHLGGSNEENLMGLFNISQEEDASGGNSLGSIRAEDEGTTSRYGGSGGMRLLPTWQNQGKEEREEIP